MNRTFSCALLLILPLLADCSGREPTGPELWTLRARELERSRELWRQAGVRSYRYTVDESCECIAGFVGPSQVTVRDDSVVSVRPLYTAHIVRQDEWAGFPTIEYLYTTIEYLIERRAYRFEVTYDGGTGLPLRIVYDVDRITADDEAVIRVSDLVAIL